VDFPGSLLLSRARDLALATAGVVGAYPVYDLTYATVSCPAGMLPDRRPRADVVAAGLGSSPRLTPVSA
jgi:hypothetical protein